MAIWKVTAKKKFNSGTVAFEPGMSVEISANTTSSSFWTQSQYRKAIAERFVSQYGLKCPISRQKFKALAERNNVNFDYTLISK